MSRVRRILPAGAVLVLGASLLAVASCQQKQANAVDPDLLQIYGNGFKDTSPVICKVGDVTITERDLQLRYEELPENMKSRFTGEDWQKRFLRYMIDETLLVEECLKKNFHRKPEVAQQLISTRRMLLKSAFTELGLMADKTPSEDRIRQTYEMTKDTYMREGQVHARDIICTTKDYAYAAYNTLRQHPGDEITYKKTVATYSINLESAKQAGDLGWFGKKGIIPALPYGKEFAETVWDWETGLHEPVLIGGQWHVVEILDKSYERPLSYQEARDRIITDLMPVFRDETIDAFTRQAKQRTPIQYFGTYQLGQGATDRELFERARIATTPEQKIDLYNLILEDYPQSSLTDATLFMLGNVYLDTWSDLPFTARYLDRLCREFPESEYYKDAHYILENMARPDFVKPKSVEDLKPKASAQ